MKNNAYICSGKPLVIDTNDIHCNAIGVVPVRSFFQKLLTVCQNKGATLFLHIVAR